MRRKGFILPPWWELGDRVRFLDEGRPFVGTVVGFDLSNTPYDRVEVLWDSGLRGYYHYEHLTDFLPANWLEVFLDA